MKRLAIITTHPIQYYAPLFKRLAHGCVLKVFYTWGEESISKYDPGFKKTIKWDIPLLDGYDYEFLRNTSNNPGTHRFNGIINPEAINRITDFNPDAILVFGWSYYSHLRILRHFKGKKAVWFRGDSTLLDASASIKQIFKYYLLRWVYSYVDKAFYVGSNNKKYYKKFGLNEEQLLFSPHAIDNDRFAVDYRGKANLLREKLGVSKNETLILFAGKLEEKKNPLILLEVFIKNKFKNTHLLFVGNGELDESLKMLAKNNTHVHFMDFQNQTMMPVIYQACDLFCLPSKGPGETWGLAVNEAMAAGKAVLISDKVGCGADLVKSDVNGGIFKHESIDDLSLKLRKMNTLEKLRKYGSNSKSLIMQYSLRSASKNILSELSNLN